MLKNASRRLVPRQKMTLLLKKLMSTTVTIGTQDNADSATLMDKWKKCYRSKPKGNKTKLFSRLLVLFLIATTLYTELRYTIAYTYSHYDPWTIYYIKVLAVYCIVMFSAYWLSCMLYGTAVENSRDQEIPSYYKTKTLPLYHKPSQLPGTVTSRSAENADVQQRHDNHDNDVFQWSHCQKCDLRTPPRAHHCNVCDKCILKRDHHCYFLGVCIGFKNQRYFVIMTFYGAVVSFWGLYLSLVFFSNNIWPFVSLSDVFIPVTFYRTIFGDFSFNHFLIVYHMYCFACFGPVATFYFSSQFTIISKGVTLYELAKNVPVRNTNSIDKNFRSVFGDFWYMNFVFPGQILFRQTEDGYFWDGIKVLNSHEKSIK